MGNCSKFYLCFFKSGSVTYSISSGCISVSGWWWGAFLRDDRVPQHGRGCNCGHGGHFHTLVAIELSIFPLVLSHQFGWVTGVPSCISNQILPSLYASLKGHHWIFGDIGNIWGYTLWSSYFITLRLGILCLLGHLSGPPRKSQSSSFESPPLTNGSVVSQPPDLTREQATRLLLPAFSS